MFVPGDEPRWIDVTDAPDGHPEPIVAACSSCDGTTTGSNGFYGSAGLRHSQGHFAGFGALTDAPVLLPESLARGELPATAHRIRLCG